MTALHVNDLRRPQLASVTALGTKNVSSRPSALTAPKRVGSSINGPSNTTIASITVCQSHPRSSATCDTDRQWRPTCNLAHLAARVVIAHDRRDLGDDRRREARRSRMFVDRVNALGPIDAERLVAGHVAVLHCTFGARRASASLQVLATLHRSAGGAGPMLDRSRSMMYRFMLLLRGGRRQHHRPAVAAGQERKASSGVVSGRGGARRARAARRRLRARGQWRRWCHPSRWPQVADPQRPLSCC